MPSGTRKLFGSAARTAPGYRYYTSGALSSIGHDGISWSAATSGINGLDLNFYSQYLNPSDTHFRGHALQLRCLSE